MHPQPDPAPPSAPPPAPAAMEVPLPAPGTMGPPAEYGRLRRECPVARVRLPVDADGWFVTRYDDVRALLADDRLTRPEITEWPVRPGQAPWDGPGLATMMELEGERHTALRKAIAEPFSARSIRARRPRMRRLADGVLDAFEQGGSPGDLVTGFAEPFPLLVACDLTGIPYDEADRFLEPADSALGAMMTLEQGREATGVLRGYLSELIGRKRREPADDVLTDLVRRCDTGELTEEDVICFGLSVLVAGYRTSTMFIADAALALLTRPDRLAALRADRSLLPSAVEELLRFLPVMNANVLLLATEDIEVAGRPVRAGEAVLPAIASANRDPEVFPDADDLVLGRDPNPHLAFGRGTHNCVGSHLARAELEIALEALLDRFPELTLAAGPGDLPWEDDSPAKSPLSLPVAW
ncbi:cytochrome P450 [Nocardiopsis sediminis]|uniref:Cytochrome P450 n=1 Tax=Nocardiopsis sediminis TaxID=1778267 RepID=A0ABV8FHG7_9ACTN